jgi:hypothetical protein
MIFLRNEIRIGNARLILGGKWSVYNLRKAFLCFGSFADPKPLFKEPSLFRGIQLREKRIYIFSKVQ